MGRLPSCANGTRHFSPATRHGPARCSPSNRASTCRAFLRKRVPGASPSRFCPCTEMDRESTSKSGIPRQTPPLRRASSSWSRRRANGVWISSRPPEPTVTKLRSQGRRCACAGCGSARGRQRTCVGVQWPWTVNAGGQRPMRAGHVAAKSPRSGHRPYVEGAWLLPEAFSLASPGAVALCLPDLPCSSDRGRWPPSRHR